MSTRLDDRALRSLIEHGHPSDARALRAVVNLWEWPYDAATLARVFPVLAELELESVSNGDLGLLGPIATLPALTRLQMTITGLATGGLPTWLAAAARPTLAIELIVVLRSRRVSARSTIRIVDGGRALEIDNPDSTTLTLPEMLGAVAPQSLAKIRVAAPPPLEERWALQREARRIGCGLAMPPVAR